MRIRTFKLEDAEFRRVSGLPCKACGTPIKAELEFCVAWNDPIEALCPECQERALREDYKRTRSGPSPQRAIRFMIADCAPGRYSGRPRLGMSIGDRESGFWDNLVRLYEDY